MLKFYYIVFSMLLFSCGSSQEIDMKLPGYDLTNPDLSVELPDVLEEISGLTDIDQHTVGCVQDEDGILFIYDLSERRIEHQYSFNIEGDYEGITKVGETMYVLRSDGMIIEIPSYKTTTTDFHKYHTGIPAANNEGLCYDQENKRLLIASKSKPGKGSENKDLRVIYGFDLEKKKLTNKPVYEIDINTVRQFAEENRFEEQTGREVDDIELKTSAIAIHPINKKLYILSAADHLLLVFSDTGEIEHIQALDDKTFNKAEGITFFDNGDMIITNEGENGHPTLLRFGFRN